VVIAETEYGQNRFCSAIRSENITGYQFHPEKSGAAGLDIYKNWINN
jgi:Glutamine amidotransferase